MPFTFASKRIKYLRIFLTEEEKDLYNVTVLKEFKEEINKRKHIICPWIGNFMLLKCQHYPKRSKKSMRYLSKFQKYFFCRNRKTHTKIHMQSEGTSKATVIKS